MRVAAFSFFCHKRFLGLLYIFFSKEISRWILCVVAEKERSEELWEFFFFYLFVGGGWVWEEH